MFSSFDWEDFLIYFILASIVFIFFRRFSILSFSGTTFSFFLDCFSYFFIFSAYFFFLEFSLDFFFSFANFSSFFLSSVNPFEEG